MTSLRCGTGSYLECTPRPRPTEDGTFSVIHTRHVVERPRGKQANHLCLLEVELELWVNYSETHKRLQQASCRKGSKCIARRDIQPNRATCRQDVTHISNTCDCGRNVCWSTGMWTTCSYDPPVKWSAAAIHASVAHGAVPIRGGCILWPQTVKRLEQLRRVAAMSEWRASL